MARDREAPYGKILRSFWKDPEVKRALTRDEKLLLLYLFTAPTGHGTGLYYCPIATIADETGLAAQAVEIALNGPLTRWVTYDYQTEEVWIHAGAKTQIGSTLAAADHKLAWVREHLETVNSHALRAKFLSRYGVTYGLLGPIEAPSKPLGSPLEGGGEAPSKPDNRYQVTDTRELEAKAVVESDDSTRPLATLVQSVPGGQAVVEVFPLEVPPTAPTNGKALVRQGRGVGLNLAGIRGMLAEMAAQGEAVTLADEQREVAADVVFAYWGHVFKHPEARLDRKRLNRIVARLKEADDNANVLLYALDGARKDDWIMGRDRDSTKKYDGIETIFRDYAQVERFAERGGYREGLVHRAAVKYLGESGGNGSNGSSLGTH